MHTPAPHGWTEISGYDLHTRDGADSVTGITRPGDRIFRGPVIENEGYFDISEYTAEQLARAIGWVPRSEADSLRMYVEGLQADNEALEAKIAELRELAKALTIDNAELYDLCGPLEEVPADEVPE